MIRILSISMLASLAALASAAAQEEDRYLSAVEYSVATPIGDTQRFGPGSWSGGAWEGRWMNHPRTSIGVLLGFNEFYQRQSGTFLFPKGAATGDQYRHLLAMPVLFTADWYFGSNTADPRWFFGGGGGLQYNEQLFEFGVNEQHRTNWSIALVPEVGLAFAAWYGTGGIVAVRYHLPTESGGFLGNTDRRFQYFSFSLGFGYR